ncbi:MAG: hypothetical protein ACFFF4_17170, partial [Candidatus Thorarchaeota archaeon]
MSINRKNGLRIVAVTFLIMSLLSSSIFVPVSATTLPESTDTDEKKEITPILVHIYYDSTSVEAKSVVLDTITTLSKSGILVEKYDISSILEIEFKLDRIRPNFAVYYFQSNTNGIQIQDQSISWEQLAQVIERASRTEHVLGIGNAIILEDYLEDTSNLHVDTADLMDVRLGRLFTLWTIADTVAASEKDGWANRGEALRETVLRDFADNINEYMAKGVMPDVYTGERVPRPITDPALTESWIEEEKQYDDDGKELQPVMKLGTLAQSGDYIRLREMLVTSGIGGPIGWLLDTVIGSLIELGFQDLAVHRNAAQNVVDHFIKVVNEAQDELQEWFNDEGFNVTDHNFEAWMPELLPRQVFEFWSLLDQIVLDTWYDVDDYIGDFFEQIINTPVQADLTGLVPVFLFRLGTPINLGSNFASFGAVLRIKLLPDFEIDKDPFETFLNDAIMGDIDLGAIPDVEDSFAEVRTFIDVIPVMDIEFAICAFLPGANDWAAGLLGQFEIEFFGTAWMEIAFPPVDASNTPRSFIDVREWGFHFELDASFSLSISAFLAPGPGGVISTILDWFSSLLSVSITLTLSIVIEISKVYQGQGLPALSTILFDIILGVTLDIRILICVFSGTFQVGLRFEQHSGVLESEPLLALANDPDVDPVIQHTLSDLSTSSIGIYVTLYCSLYFGVDLFFTSFGTHFGGPWTETFELSSSWGDGDYGTEAADLTDTDLDGLTDAFEEAVSAGALENGFLLAANPFYLNPNSDDTDSDGLKDKLEIELNTNPNDADSDDDGLTDYEEHVTYMTDPLLPDTDRDNLTDYEEVMIYHTSPFIIDTDGDMLYDWY